MLKYREGYWYQTTPVMLKYKEGYWYQTTEGQSIQLPFVCQDYTSDGHWVSIRAGRLFTRFGYAWDGASFVLFRWFGTPKRWLVPSLFHDALYQTIREGKLGREYRDAVDCMFYEALRARGVSWLVATVAYHCIRVGGNFEVRTTNPIREAL